MQANLSLFKFQLYGSKTKGDAHLAQGLYLGLNYLPKLKASAYAVTAIKAGIEGSNTPIGYYALEFKHVSNFKGINDFIKMPKLGMCIVGLYSIYYGYNISTNKNPFPFIGNNQLGLNFTLFAPNYRKLGTGVFRYRQYITQHCSTWNVYNTFSFNIYAYPLFFFSNVLITSASESF